MARHTNHSAESERFEGLDAQDAIARRAYELFEQRGGAPGRDIEDWLRAEHDIRQQTRATSPQ